MEIMDIITKARRFREEAGWTRTRFARECGFKSDTMLQGLDRRDWNPTKKTLDRLAEFLGDWEPGDPIPEEEAA